MLELLIVRDIKTLGKLDEYFKTRRIRIKFEEMKLIRYVILFGSLFFLSGCTKEGVDPTIPLGLLTKSRDFLFFCLSVIDSSKPLYNQFASRYYYSMFSIAKIISIWKHKHFANELETHEDVWRVMCKNPRKKFGTDLKKIRTKCDYDYKITDSSSESIKDDLLPIILDNTAFEELLDDACNTIDMFYERLQNNNDKEKCNQIIDEIISCRNNIINVINDPSRVTAQIKVYEIASKEAKSDSCES